MVRRSSAKYWRPSRSSRNPLVQSHWGSTSCLVTLRNQTWVWILTSTFTWHLPCVSLLTQETVPLISLFFFSFLIIENNVRRFSVIQVNITVEGFRLDNRTGSDSCQVKDISPLIQNAFWMRGETSSTSQQQSPLLLTESFCFKLKKTNTNMDFFKFYFTFTKNKPGVAELCGLLTVEVTDLAVPDCWKRSLKLYSPGWSVVTGTVEDGGVAPSFTDVSGSNSNKFSSKPDRSCKNRKKDSKL